MVEKIVGEAEILLTPDELALFDQQVEAGQSADTSKLDADYQNEPHDGEQCSGCSMFVPGLSDDAGGYCTKVESIRGPTGMIFPDGWCKFFEPDDVDDLDDLDEIA